MSDKRNPGIPSDKGEPPPEWAMRTYVLALLYTGPYKPRDPEESNRLFHAHLASNARLHREGKLILAGPMRDNTDLRGIFVFDSDSVDQVKAWCDGDPAIAAGVFRLEIHPWYSAKGITIVPPQTTEAGAGAGAGGSAADAVGAGRAAAAKSAARRKR
ncbi:MAG TPA: YciI family protein [Candidatus Eisenbacteria bacterium]